MRFHVPWWFCIAVALALNCSRKHIKPITALSTAWNHARHWSTGDADPSTDLMTGSPELVTDLSATVANNSSNLIKQTVVLSMPCLTVGIGTFQVNLTSPCGEVPIPPGGLNWSTPVGNYTIPGAERFREIEKKFDETIGEDMLDMIVAGLTSLFALYLMINPMRREEWLVSLSDMCSGSRVMDVPYDDLKESKTPDSKHFIAPGNVYRVVAVLHPGVLRFWKLVPCMWKVLLCTIMQLYLPISILGTILDEYTRDGYRTPFFFATNFVSFVTSVAALGSLCIVFQKKCADNIKKGAQANFFIMTHYPEDGIVGLMRFAPGMLDAFANHAAESEQEKENYLEEALHGVTDAVLESDWYDDINLTTAREAVMFFKVATLIASKGSLSHTEEITVQAVALYFVFDLDQKVFEEHEALRKQYRSLVTAMTEPMPEEQQPRWFRRIASISIGISGFLNPVGIVMIVMCHWHKN